MGHPRDFWPRHDGLDQIRLVSAQLQELVTADEAVDQAAVRCLFPGLREAAPHCPGDPLIFWDDPFMKQPVPRVTESVDAVLLVAEKLDKLSGPDDFKYSTSAFLSQTSAIVSARGTRGEKLSGVTARVMIHCILERALWVGLDKLEERRITEIKQRAEAVQA